MVVERIGRLARLSLLGTMVSLAWPVTAWADAASALRVEYHQWQVGKDGVRQELSYAEKLYRQENALWVEREVPEAAQRDHDDHHHGGLGHKHADVVGAPLWIQRDGDGNVDVKLVDRYEQRLIDIAPPYYGNVGYDGHWVETWALLDPATLSALEPSSVAENGVETYQIQRGSQYITLVWNPERRYAVSIRARDEHGLSGRTIEAEEITDPNPLPWTALEGYRNRDYSDLLD
ncbi:signal peptide protein [Alcanivorax xiamenensis]|uniref:Signal peptide protein n=1 Tax=Alcanivorax xiamenensis TaxID=1177156 RepID=A0ABQ6YC55_9GAMM|nr:MULTISPECIES: hypothetical protein [Alcanivorax]KAF0807705.1 signal peptide protein [Alcanivorax xiamenensis]